MFIKIIVMQTERKTSSNLCIYGTVEGSRFGTAIASMDLDGDGLSGKILYIYTIRN